MKYCVAIYFLFSSALAFSQKSDSTFHKITLNPTFFDGKEVEIIGYAILKPIVDKYIVLDTNDHTLKIWLSNVSYSLLQRKYFGDLNNKRVVVRGIFIKHPPAINPLSIGSIRNITKLEKY